MLQIRRNSHIFFLLIVNHYGIFASAFTRRSCDSLICPQDWDLIPWPYVGGVLDSADAVLDWLLPGPVNTPTDTPKQIQPDVELMVTYPPAEECDAAALPGSTGSQEVSPQNRLGYLRIPFC